MQRKLRKFVPRFLQKIDHDWMLNRPFLWATRIHYVLFFGLLGLGVSMVFGLLQPISPAKIPISTSFLILTAVPALMALAYWWYRLSTVFSDTSHEPSIWRRNLALIIVGSLLMIAVPASGWFVMEWRAMEVRNEIDRYEDTQTFAKGLHFFESKLPTKLYYSYRKGESPIHSWLYTYHSDQAEKEFLQSDPAVLAQAFLQVAHKYTPDAFPLSPQELVEGYELQYFPTDFDQDALWHWRQEVMEKINYWENMGALNPFNIHSGAEFPSIAGMNWEDIYAGVILCLIPFLGLGLCFVYLGFRPFIGFVLSMVALMGLVGLLAQFMTYRVEIGESIYGMTAIFSFFAIFFGFSQPNAKSWQRSAQQIALLVGLIGIYGLLVLAPSVLFNAIADGPPSLPLYLGILMVMTSLWLGPIRTRINFLQTTPSAR